MGRKKQVDTKYILIGKAIDDCRQKLILADIDIKFWIIAIAKAKAGELKMKRYMTLPDAENNLLVLQEMYEIELERLNFLKGVRDTRKNKKLSTEISISTPAVIEVQISE